MNEYHASVLVADDDAMNRVIVARTLEHQSHRAVLAVDGGEALRIVHSQPVDIILLDIVMPGVDGIEVARLAAARTPDLRIMFITGFAAVALAAGSRAPEGAKVLSKPVHLREIVSEVERMIAA